MAENLNMLYADIMIAAIVLAVLFYLALLLQLDNYAAKIRLKGLPVSEISKMWRTFFRLALPFQLGGSDLHAAGHAD